MSATLGGVCAFLNGGTPSRSVARYFEGDIPWITGSDINGPIVNEARSSITDEAISDSATNLVPAGTILLVTRTSVGKVAVAGTPLCFSQDITAITPDPAKLDTGYLVHLLRTKQSHFERVARGATIKGVTREAVADIRVPLPPLPEQRRIADILDKADALRTKRRATLAQLDTLAQSIFFDMFGDPATNPKGWNVKPLACLVRDDDTINYGVVQPGDDIEDGVPLIRVGDLIDGKVRPSRLKQIAPSIEAAYKRSRLRGDEILVSCVGSIGVIALADESLKGFNIARAVARIPLADGTNRLFMAAYLNTDHVQRYFINELRTVSQPTLNIKQLSETIVVLPPIELQLEFARRVSAVKKVQSTHRDAIAELDVLFASLQHRTFRGDLVSPSRRQPTT